MTRTDAARASRSFARLVLLGVVAFLAFQATNPAEVAHAERPTAEGSALALVESHGCWTEFAPEGVEAGSVVVTIKGVTTWTRDAKVLHNALDQALYSNSHGYTVHGFCR